MTKRIIAIIFIFILTTIAWAILGGTILSRTYDSSENSSSRVASTWGTEQNQSPPTAFYKTPVQVQEESVENGKKIVKTVTHEEITNLDLQSSKIDVNLNLAHRQKGLLWYSTYKVDFAAAYTFRNPSDKKEWVQFDLKFPTTQAIYDNLIFTVDGTPVSLTTNNNAATGYVEIAAGKVAQVNIGYSSQGLNEWRYSFGDHDVSQVRDFTLKMKTDFKDIDFPNNTLSPSEKAETGNGWDLTWSYKNLLSGYQIAMVMPEKLQPGPLAGRISFFAPVSLFFFFFLMLIITTMRGIDLHPMNYFFLAAAFFSFHLLLAYLVDHVSIHASFDALRIAVQSIFAHKLRAFLTLIGIIIGVASVVTVGASISGLNTYVVDKVAKILGQQPLHDRAHGVQRPLSDEEFERMNRRNKRLNWDDYEWVRDHCKTCAEVGAQVRGQAI
jgi:inner membrane protein involved in colicin E2 resistance